MIFSTTFPFIQQNNSTDCGLACLAMISKFYGENISVAEMQTRITLTKNGLYAQDLSRVAESLGFRSLLVKIDIDKLQNRVNAPCIIHWKQNHFITVYKVSKTTVYYADPAIGLLSCSKETFITNWYSEGEEGFALLLETTPQFFNSSESKKKANINKANIAYILKYLVKYKFHFGLLIISLLIGSALQLLLPFLTQWIIDYGISYKDSDFVYLAVGALFTVYISNTIIDFLRSRLLIHLSSRVNIFIISDFLIKLMNLPLTFFDGRFKGDLIQRVRDHDRIERFLTDTLLKSIFSVFSVIVFSFALAYYNAPIFAIFLVFTVFEIGWIFFYLKRMRGYTNNFDPLPPILN